MTPLLIACSSSPALRQLQQHEQVDHAGDRDLALADADRLDDHDVEAGRLAHQHRLARARGHAAERAAGGRRADERVARRRDSSLHARLVAEDRAAGARARRIDRQHRDPWPASIRCRPSASMKVDLPDARRAR